VQGELEQHHLLQVHLFIMQVVAEEQVKEYYLVELVVLEVVELELELELQEQLILVVAVVLEMVEQQQAVQV
jgi:hypothetical protein